MPTRAGSYRWTGSCSTPSTRRARPPSAASPAGPPAGPSPAAGLDGVDWIAPALAALDRGEPLPAPFDDPRRAWDRFFTDARTALTAPGPPGAGQGAPLCRALALPALRAAADPDPLRAALGALFAAAVTHGTDYPGLFAEARRCFPDLRADASPQA
ncbi:hypothetical protein [Streptomyces sp. LRa12]|uniref:hypothetical protein n=1 Tax=Streptomyces sp. LRa12 TaxID=2563107 RepID=UPI001F0FBD8E|nr:hypothetical protein [Streptomyces sp. LRa12]